MTAKSLIKALISIGIVACSVICLYSISSKSSPFVYDYANELDKQKQDMLGRLSLLRLNSDCAAVSELWQKLCQLALCKGDLPSALSYLVYLFHTGSANAIDNTDQFSIYLFGGNIYRDCGKLRKSQECYEKSLSELDKLKLASKTNINMLEIQTNKALNLNNVGIIYYLTAKTKLNREEQKKDYYAAAKYFDQANSLIAKNSNLCLSKVIENNMILSSTELKFLN